MVINVDQQKNFGIKISRKLFNSFLFPSQTLPVLCNLLYKANPIRFSEKRFLSIQTAKNANDKENTWDTWLFWILADYIICRVLKKENEVVKTTPWGWSEAESDKAVPRDLVYITNWHWAPGQVTLQL